MFKYSVPLKAAALICAAALTTPATAQETTPDQAPLEIPELVVTASGVASDRLSHAGNITRVDQEEIQFVRPDHPTELLNRQPGINIQRGNGQEHLTAIRSPVLTAGAGAGSFLYLEDGIPLRAAGFANVNGLFEAVPESAGAVELVRGPGSALYGSNAVHGLINVLSRAPSQALENELNLSAGPHGLFHATATSSASFGGADDAVHHGVRASLAFGEDDGFRANSGFGQQKFQLRHDMDIGNDEIRTTLSGHNLEQETAGFVIGPRAFRDDALRKTNPNPEAFRDAWALRAAVRWDHELSDNARLILTPYTRTTDMRFLMHFLPGQATEENDHQSVGLLAALHQDIGEGHQIVLGLDTEYTDGHLREFQEGPTVFSFVQGLHYDYDVGALVLAPYVHSKWALGDNTHVTAGLRLEYTRYDYDNNAPNNIVGRFQRISDRTETFFNATPKLGLTHTFSDEVTSFVNIARSARAPQTTDIFRLQSAQVPGQVESERLDSAEVGARGTFSGISYELAAYYMKKKNFFFRDANGLNMPNGRTEHLGVEAEFSAPLGLGFDVSGTATYARHTYDFSNPIIAGPNMTESITNGDDVDTAPRTLANIRLGYTFLEGDARAELEWIHTGDYFMDASNSVRYPGHNLFNLRADVAVTDNLSVYSRLTNLTDKRYAERADFAFGNERYFPGEDRAVHLGGTVRF